MPAFLHPAGLRRRLSEQARLVLLLALFGLVLLGLDAWRSLSQRAIELREYAQETANLAWSLARVTHDVLANADLRLLQARDRLEAQAGLPGGGGLSAVDAAGHALPDSAAEPELLDAVRAFHRGDAGRLLHISDPVRRSDGSWVLVLSRRIDGPDGRFGGVVALALPIGLLKSLYASIQIGQDGIITLILPNGVAAIRQTENATAVGTDVSRGEFLRRYAQAADHGDVAYTATVDGVSRVGSFRHIPPYGLVIVVAHGADEVLAAWREDALLHFAISGAAVGLLTWLGVLFAGHTARRQRIERNYRLLAEFSRDVIVCVTPALRRLYVSPSITALTGWSVAESLVQQPQDFVVAEDMPAIQALTAEMQGGAAQATACFRYRRRDGTLIWVEGHYQRIAGPAGGAPQFVGNLRDVSAGKAAEQQLAATNRELSALAHIDALTGLANRRRLDEHLQQEWRRAVRSHEDLSLLLIDVDRFKAFNDLYGHPQGDRCLAAVAAAITGLTRRPGDLAARYGGEEVVVVLPGIDLAGAGALGEAMRAGIMALAEPHRGNPPTGRVTVSVGVATLRKPATTAAPGAATIDGLMARADAALYEAKRRGRNCVVTESEMPANPIAATPADEGHRLAAVARYLARDGSGGDRCLDQVARLTASLFDMPTALVSLVGAEQQVFVGRVGLDAEATSRDDAFCAHTILGDDVFTVADATADARFRDNPLVTGDPNIRFYAGAPLISPNGGHRVGSLCLLDTIPRPALDPAQKVLLADLASLVVSHLEHGRAIGAVTP